MAEVTRLCVLLGEAEAAKFYGWTDQGGLFRVADSSERGQGTRMVARRDRIEQSVIEDDVRGYLRLRARRAAIGSRHEPAWSLVAHPATRLLADLAGAHLDIHLDPDEQGYEGDEFIAEGNGIRIRYVYLVKGMSLMQAELGDSDHGSVEYWSTSLSTIIHIRRLRLPETTMLAMTGMRLAELMPHPLFDALDLRIQSVDLDPEGAERGTHIDVGTAWEPLVPHHEPRPWLIPG